MQNIKKEIKRWVDNQHMAIWCGPSSTQETGSKTDFGS